jgi:hypothetical protein
MIWHNGLAKNSNHQVLFLELTYPKVLISSPSFPFFSTSEVRLPWFIITRIQYIYCDVLKNKRRFIFISPFFQIGIIEQKTYLKTTCMKQYYNGQYLIRYLFCSKQVQKVCYVPFAWSCSQFRNLMRLSFFEIWQNDFRHAVNMIIHVKTFPSVILVWKSTAD